MLLKEERKLVVEYGKKLITENLTTGTGGNISVLNKEKGYFAISPSGMDYFETEPEDVVIMDLDGKIIDGDKKPSSEYHMHLLIYQNFKEAGAAIHCHSTFATVLSTVREDLPASNYIIGDAGGNNVRCARYETFGTVEIGQATVEAMNGRKACLNANHGQTCYGKNIKSAFSLARNVEQLSKVHVLAKMIGTPVILPDDEMEKILVKFGSYGQNSPNNKQ